MYLNLIQTSFTLSFQPFARFLVPVKKVLPYLFADNQYIFLKKRTTGFNHHLFVFTGHAYLRWFTMYGADHLFYSFFNFLLERFVWSFKIHFPKCKKSLYLIKYDCFEQEKDI